MTFYCLCYESTIVYLEIKSFRKTEIFQKLNFLKNTSAVRRRKEWKTVFKNMGLTILGKALHLSSVKNSYQLL